jgi:hypothetical protein
MIIYIYTYIYIVRESKIVLVSPFEGVWDVEEIKKMLVMKNIEITHQYMNIK